MLGARALASLCAEIEGLARSGAGPSAAALVDVVEGAYRAIEATLKAESEKLGSSAGR